MRSWQKEAVALPTITNEIYNLLQPLDPAERRRAINAALTLLGDPTIGTGSGKDVPKDEAEDGDDGDVSDLHAKGRAWMRKYKITPEQIEHVFQFDGETAEVIADDVPGKSAKDKTISAYVITGIGKYLKTGEISFDDKTARAVCKHIGCLNTANHSTYLDSRKNLFSGSKKAGWKLTAPGLKKGAEWVQEIAGGE